MDLTKKFPRSPYDMNAGIVILPRTTDKAKAYNKGKLGEYSYNCPLDKALFNFLGIDAEQFAAKVKELETDPAIAGWVNKAYPKTQEEQDNFNNKARHDRPQDKESKAWLASEKKRLGRNDYETYFDNLDADEKRF